MANAADRSDEQMDRVLGGLLRAGVVLAAGIVVAGGGLFLDRHGAESRDYRVFRGEPAELRHPGGIVRSAAAGDDRGLIAVGLLVLIATPIARVAASIVAFLRQRDSLYVAVTSFVLAVLLYSLAGG
jgi:uncharacterized membrane protein